MKIKVIILPKETEKYIEKLEELNTLNLSKLGKEEFILWLVQTTAFFEDLTSEINDGELSITTVFNLLAFMRPLQLAVDTCTGKSRSLFEIGDELDSL